MDLPKTLSRTGLGATGEELAISYLKKLGYRIVERNFRCKLGEIDVVAYDGNTLVFVEVRTKKSSHFGSPVSSVSYQKQRKLISLAKFYIKKHKLFNRSARFDVVGVRFGSDGSFRINLIQNAFEEY